MAKTFSRTTVGDHFNEGARLMWAALKETGDGFGKLEKKIDAPRGLSVRWLYGDGRPGAAFRIRMLDSYGIPIGAWDDAATVDFVVPALRESEVSEDDAEIPGVEIAVGAR